MSVNEQRIPPSGMFRLTGFDQYDYCDYFVGDFPSLEGAMEEARSRAMEPNASPSSFSDIFFVYDHCGVCRYQITHDEL